MKATKQMRYYVFSDVDKALDGCHRSPWLTDLIFRPLDVLICEDHPVSRMVMEKLLEKLRCRTITVSDGAEAMRYAMSEIKFDIIMMEVKLPKINGADVARMIRDTKNANSQTPIVAVTGYLKELQAPHHFDSLIEKPPTTSKLTEAMCSTLPMEGSSSRPGQHQSSWLSTTVWPSTRKFRLEDSPTSGSSGYAHMPGSSFRGSSREDSISSSMFGEESFMNDDIPVVISRKATGDWEDASGLGISHEEAIDVSNDLPKQLPLHLLHQESSPAAWNTKASSDSGHWRRRKPSASRSRNIVMNVPSLEMMRMRNLVMQLFEKRAQGVL